MLFHLIPSAFTDESAAIELMCEFFLRFVFKKKPQVRMNPGFTEFQEKEDRLMFTERGICCSLVSALVAVGLSHYSALAEIWMPAFLFSIARACVVMQILTRQRMDIPMSELKVMLMCFMSPPSKNEPTPYLFTGYEKKRWLEIVSDRTQDGLKPLELIDSFESFRIDFG